MTQVNVPPMKKRVQNIYLQVDNLFKNDYSLSGHYMQITVAYNAIVTCIYMFSNLLVHVTEYIWL